MAHRSIRIREDTKFGIMFHWGIYSVPGIAESWALCSEDRWFTDRREKHFREVPIVNLRNGIGDYPNPSNQAVLSQPNGLHL